jgi:hypothetical protein
MVGTRPAPGVNNPIMPVQPGGPRGKLGRVFLGSDLYQSSTKRMCTVRGGQGLRQVLAPFRFRESDNNQLESSLTASGRILAYLFVLQHVEDALPVQQSFAAGVVHLISNNGLRDRSVSVY